MTRLLLALSFLGLLPGCVGGKPSDTDGTDPDPVDACDETPGACDEDGDGYRVSDGDCDDADATVNPGTIEICDGRDQNCDGAVDEDVQTTFYQDFDGDGFGSPDAPQAACEAPGGYVANGTDCDDGEASAFPGANEVCDGIDNDCDGTIDNGVTTTFYADADGDTYGDPDTAFASCTAPVGYVTDSADCDDTTNRSYPGNGEVCDELDNNCDGTVDEGVTTTYYADFDGDRYGNVDLTQEACSLPTGYRLDATDCDDSVAAVNPAATEVCNTIDDNCDGFVDEDTAADSVTWYIDTDADGYGNAGVPTVSCSQPFGYVRDATDCDDGRALSNPTAIEYCNTFDDDCDGTVDEDAAVDAPTWYLDADADLYGNATITDVTCYQPAGYVADSTDCNDGTARANPGAVEYCDYLDNDCDGDTDEDSAADARTWYADADSDAYGDPATSDIECYAPSGYVSNSTDCDDARAASNPAAPEYCNTHDDDCDGTVDEDSAVDADTWYQDADSDAYGDPSATDVACSAPSGYIADSTDCDDTRALTNLSATEYCNLIDDDCDRTVDENSAADALTWYLDSDADTFGTSSVSSVACYQPASYVADSTDCNDGTARAYPGATEYCDSIDNDCDGTIDEDTSADARTWYADADSDTYGNAAVSDVECSQPSGYVSNATDCDDARAATYPTAPEYCNTHDDDCDGTVDEDASLDASTWYRDADSDLYGSSAVSDVACYVPSGYVADRTDCDDARALTNPAATEYCNLIDDDCDGSIDENSAADAATWYRDADADTYGTSTVSSVACTQPSGYVSDGTDCLDTSAISYPGATEICDGLDNDCDGTVDDDPTGGNTYYADTDSDGFGDAGSTTEECSLPSGYVENDYDCEDADSGEPKVADIALGASTGNGSLTRPYDLIQDAIDDAFLCVVVYQGTYNEQIDLSAGRDLDIWGVEGADLTIIDANLSVCGASNPTACAAAMTIDSASNAAPTLHGLTITGGTGDMSSSTTSTTCADSSASHSGRTSCSITTYEYCGGGVMIDGDDPYFYDVIIRDNTLPEFTQTTNGSWAQTWMYSYGGGVCMRNSNAMFVTSVIEGNYADQGGGIYAEDSSAFEFEQGMVSNNDAADGGGLNLHAASGMLNNMAVACNTATTDGGGLYQESSGTATFTNTVLYGNSSSTSGSSRGSEAYIGTSTTFNLYNSIAQANTRVYAIFGAGGTGTHQYNNVYNSAGTAYGGTLSAGLGAVSAGSNFTSAGCDNNPYNDDFTLRSASSSINAGNPAAASNDTNGTRNDQGAFGGPDGDWEL